MFHVKPSDLPAPPPAAERVFGRNVEKAVAYHLSLATVGSQRGFIGPREVPRLWDRHVLNCAVIGEVMPEGVSVVDVGSGAGLPGIPLALARPDLSITLVEPLLKRSVYLGEVVEQLGLGNVRVVRGRAEEKALRAEVGKAEVVTSRAVAPLGRLCQWSMPLVAKAGAMIAMKGASVREELERDERQIRAAGGGRAQVIRVGEQLLPEPSTVVRIPKVR
ncbi:16S rRNA (guanine(527)-N(7))-methyltransferase RsmG [Corynebacterium sp. zg-331]|uniref:16S rRNA (guanine(527)-N(7))-methyltransferase RsmG n=1 Tax=unclassified Corynebacterium TaxID=2624378 RepID=UPI00128CDE70|nr:MULTISPECIES: 16S rRNA (guanine(527)-N(7))-methyltransferase RsmG [unclassified Corynebacterium]MBC3186486.1 16S rRNA (guanine(527)-N(7))-methyltransferase RsmG [Corynebacterium sp. zg-331]MPV52971.1 16S rRNA (guanine(527)-N(7))-methyltransferase RsmG [Corynebacterium sp. zg331]